MTGGALVWISFILGLAASLIGVVTFMFPGFRRWLIQLVRPSRQYNWKDVPTNIQNATRRVYILQTWLPGFRMERPYWKEALARDNLRFRVLLLDQKLVAFRLRCREQESSLLTQNVVDLTDLANAQETKAPLKARFYSCIPFGPIYIIDDDVFWGIYYANRDSILGPAFHCRANSILGKLIVASYEAVWQSGIGRSGTLVLPGFGDRQAMAPAEQDTAIRERIRSIRLLDRGQELDEIGADQGALVLIRHAETDLNERELFTGDLEVGINYDGLEQARSLAPVLRPLRWDRILSSPLRRSVDTLTVIFGKKLEQVELRDELRERSMGEVEGFSKQTYAKSLPRYQGIDLIHGFYARPEEGESYADVFWRIVPVLEELLSGARAGDRVLVCSHEIPIRVFRMVLEGLEPESVTQKEVGNCEVFVYRPAEPRSEK